MAVINILNPEVAELIAAGEVVERPASVVKELVENSIDAGAKHILVDIENGGIKKILVQDDGSGIDSEYVKTAFIRHATSKINSALDLDSIMSLGFRGEALASIASVSKIELITQTENQDFAVEIKLEAGKEKSFEVKPFINGTRFIIRDLFYNTPARMKFLKKDATEASYIQDILTNLALSCPDIAFTFKKDSKEIFSTIGDGSLINTIASLFGYEFSKDLCSVSFSDKGYSVEGFTSLPFKSRQSRNMQFSFINGRFVKNKTVIAAVENAYKGTVMSGKYPAYVLNISMPYDLIDVNVHPAKTEVRFSNESDIFSLIYKAVKQSVMQDETLKEFSFKKDDFKLENYKDENVKQTSFTHTIPATHNQKTENTYQNFNISSITDDFKEKTDNFNKKYIIPTIQKDVDEDDFILNSNKLNYSTQTTPLAIVVDNSENSKNTDEKLDEYYHIEIFTEIFSTYILCTIDGEFVIIDKHAAHERLLFEQIKRNEVIQSQLLLVPATVKLNASEKEAVMQNIDLLKQYGFEVDEFGMDSIILRAVPINITTQDPQTLISEIAYNLSNNEKDEISEKLSWLYHSVSCRSAIKAGDKNHNEELKQLVSDIKNQKIPLYCPHGRPIMITITKKELEKQFGR